MDAFQPWLLKLVGLRHGGRTIRTDEQTVLLYDCAVWTEAHSNAVKAKCPECDITITQSQGSLSGFVIVFKMHVDKSFRSWITALAVMFALLFFTVRQMIL